MNATGHGNGNVKAEIIKRKLMLKADDYDHVLMDKRNIQQSAGVNIPHAAGFEQKSCGKTNSPSK